MDMNLDNNEDIIIDKRRRINSVGNIGSVTERKLKKKLLHHYKNEIQNHKKHNDHHKKGYRRRRQGRDDDDDISRMKLKRKYSDEYSDLDNGKKYNRRGDYSDDHGSSRNYNKHHKRSSDYDEYEVLKGDKDLRRTKREDIYGDYDWSSEEDQYGRKIHKSHSKGKNKDMKSSKNKRGNIKDSEDNKTRDKGRNGTKLDDKQGKEYNKDLNEDEKEPHKKSESREELRKRFNLGPDSLKNPTIDDYEIQSEGEWVSKVGSKMKPRDLRRTNSDGNPGFIPKDGVNSKIDDRSEERRVGKE